jgi:archaellum component FlaF (FlaF/FlaG flagellin family)
LDKVITTALLIIAGVVVAVMLYNVVYPAVIQSGEALTRRQRRIDERLDSQIEIIHATGRVSTSNAYVWVKNVGSSSIKTIERCDIFFGPEGNFSRISYGDWTYAIENDTEWKPAATLGITITGDLLVADTTYFVKVGLPNGVSDDYYFSPSE